MRCSIWRDIKKSSGTMIVDTGCCWCSVPSSLIIRVHLSRILSAETDVYPCPHFLSLLPVLSILTFSLSAPLQCSVFSPPPHSLSLKDIIISYHTFTSYHHSSSSTCHPHCFFSSPSLVSLLTAPFRSPEDASAYFALLLYEYSHFFSFGFYHLGMLRFLHTVIKQNEKDSVFPLWECLFAVKVFNELSVSIFFFVVLSLFWKKCN